MKNGLALLFLSFCCTIVFAQKPLVFPLDTEGVSLRHFARVHLDLPRKATLAELEKADFQTADPSVLAKGHTTIWVKCIIENRDAQAVQINMTFERWLAITQIFRKDRDRLTLLGQTSNRRPMHGQLFLHKYAAMQVPLRPASRDTFYLLQFDLATNINRQPFPTVSSGDVLSKTYLTKLYRRFEPERWFYFFMAGFSILMCFWAFFKAAATQWDRANLYCSLMFLSNFFNCWLWTKTVSLPDWPIFSETSASSSLGLLFNHLTPLLMWLLYRSFLNLRTESPRLYWFLTVGIWVLVVLNLVLFALSLRLDTIFWSRKFETAVETVMLTMQLVLPFALLRFFRHPIYRFAALSSWVLLVAFACFLLTYRMDWQVYLPVGFYPSFIIFIGLAVDGILFMVALTLRDRQIAVENLQLQQQNTANELKALRAQMNPHFIFNCLNSIKSYALNKDTEGVNFYLTKFSKLMRQVLDNSRNEKISLKNELETLQLYLEMEQLRVGDRFDFAIQVDEAVETDFVEVPPMLIQPYVENAIWHGLVHLETRGKVTVSVSQKDDKKLIIKILDNGIGRAKAAEIKSKTGSTHKSFGMQITAERLNIIRQLYQIDTQLVIEDLKNQEGAPAGTLVCLELPL